MVLERLSMAGRTVIVTGAGRGLGKQMALALADAGADIACAARTEAQIVQTAEEIRAKGRRALVIPTNVAQSDQVDRMVRRTLDEWGRIDVLISNAGGGSSTARKHVTEIDNEGWYATLDVNLSAAFFGARAVVPHFQERGGGVIINISSGTGLRGDSRLMVYGAAKAALINLTMSLATQLIRDKIRVNCIVPGYVLQSPPETEDEISRAKAQGQFNPSGRVGEAWELGPLAVYLSSDASSYVTGESFVIDGGGAAVAYAPIGWDVTAGATGG